ncbi:MATE family efflux transporter [Pedobacter alluvionis]|uniref:O-antigen/teichoic acid export membrane protein n=1 Tax=Pedobacter alluvionis TaxID=475253 RepID=A0A497XVY1_9SPHI|nr:polysaccharide biosynthesis protein [Pedobacter alluvionis]RLJ73913.1 O-antigen/teichoic acid export membrane protein [Pedobacter alluvionis]TFB32481.1 polysaccharide biosynthesis protein [Pedobacter alluvionis]
MSGAKDSNLLKWIKLISITGGAQAIVQLTSLLCGLLIIRLLPTKEYALYTLANTMLGTMSLLSDGGISTGVLALGGKVWEDKKKLGIVLSTGLQLRKKFAFFSLSIAVPILVYLLLHHGASILTTVLIVMALIPSFYSTLSDSLLEIIPKLHQDIRPLQENQIKVSVLRLTISALTVFLFPFTFIAIWAAGIPRILGNIKLRKIAGKFTETSNEIDPGVQKEIFKIVKRILPGAIYYCLASQLTVWLISIFGNTANIAEVGALGRLSMLLGVISTMFSILIVPRFARTKESGKALLKRYLFILAAMLVILSGITFIVMLFASQLLWVLGDQYANLEKELVYVMIGYSANVLMGLAIALYTSKGWVINPVYAITLSVLLIISGIFIFDLTKISGVLKLNIFIAVSELMIHFVFGFFKTWSVEKE